MLKTLAIVTAVSSVLAVALVLIWSRGVQPAAEASHGSTPQQIDFVAIDADPSGTPANTPTSLGTIENCFEITGIGSTTEIDVVVDEIDAADRMKGFEFNISYDPTVISLSVTGPGIDENQLIVANAGSSALVLSSHPDKDGVTPDTIKPAATDIGFPIPDVHESGEGVLARLTVTSVAQGTSPLDLFGTIVVAGTGPLINTGIPIAPAAPEDRDATISVDEPCAFTTLAPNVLIAGLDCNSSREVVRIKNFGGTAQDLAGWELRSDPVGSETLDLDTTVPDDLEPNKQAFFWSGAGSGGASESQNQFQWDTAEIFRDGDSTDFARLVDGADTVIDEESCVNGEIIEDVVGGFTQAAKEDGVLGTCNDTVDNGGDTTTDAADPDCLVFDGSLEEAQEGGSGPGTCTNDEDDDGDTLIDEADPDCPGGTCADAADNDGDTVSDADDDDCSRLESSLNEDGIGACGDGVDNGGGDGADAADEDCLGFVSTDGTLLDTGQNGAQPDDILETTVTSPNKGTVRIVEDTTTQSPPAGVDIVFIDQEATITAPATTADDPLLIEFVVEGTIVPKGEDENTMEVFLDGVLVPDCTGAAGTASPDPCVSFRGIQQLGPTDLKVAVLSSTGGIWNLGFPPPAPPPSPTPKPSPSSSPVATVLPPTGDSVPVGSDGGGSLIPWLLVGLGAAVIVAAGGYAVYGRTRGRPTR